MKARIELPPKLRPVFLGEARVRGAFGGRGSAKTRSFAKMAAVRGYMFGMSGQEGIILCAREFMNSLDDSSMEEIKIAIREEEFLNDYYEIGEKYIRSRDGRIRFAFAGLRHNLNSIKSKARILLCWIDEAEPVLEESLRKLIPTIREEGSELWATWNPESKRSAVNKRFRESNDADVRIVELNWRDNPWFPDVLNTERLRDKRDRPEVYDHIWEGAFLIHAVGAYYTKQLRAMRDEGRIGSVEPSEAFPVHTAWDLGIGDSTAIWLWQAVPGGIKVLDYIEDHGQPLEHYAALLKAKGHDYGYDFVPHDAKARELGTGRTRVETMDMLGLKPRLVPLHTVDDGINAVREVLGKMWIDETRCELGLEALAEYRTEFDEDKDMFKPRPLHNWASHGADAARYIAMAYRELTTTTKPEKPKPKPGQVYLPGPPEPRKSTRISL